MTLLNVNHNDPARKALLARACDVIDAKQIERKGHTLQDNWRNHANALNGIHLHYLQNADVKFFIKELGRAGLVLSAWKSKISYHVRWVAWRNAFEQLVNALVGYKPQSVQEQKTLDTVMGRALALEKIAYFSL